MDNTYPTFTENFRECCARSCACFERDEDDPAYAAAPEECDELYRRIGEKLGSERILVNRFDAAKNYQLALEGSRFTTRVSGIVSPYCAGSDLSAEQRPGTMVPGRLYEKSQSVGKQFWAAALIIWAG